MWMLLACSTYPSSIPDQAGDFDAEMLGDLWAASSPATFTTLYAGLARGTFADDVTPCPLQTKNDAGLLLAGDGCTDRWGTTWSGSMTVLERDGFAQFDRFGPAYDDWRGTQDWTADGKLYWTIDGTSAHIDMEVELLFDGTVLWVDGAGQFDSASELSNRQGTVGVEAWGTAQVEHGPLIIAGANGCEVPSDGSITYQAVDALRLELPLSDECVPDSPGAPPPEICLEFGDVGALCSHDGATPTVPPSVDDPTGG